jgi:N-acetylmuramoyl-L-alanine amidase
MKRLFVTIYVIGLLYSCANNPYAASNRSYKKQAKAYAKELRQYPLRDSMLTAAKWVGTTNFNLRRPNFVIIHHTAQNSCDQTLRTFTLKRTQVSSHYVICKDGTVHHMLHDYFRAWHGGASKWGNTTDINSSSIGIELDNNGFEPFPEEQINSLIILLRKLKNAYSIPSANFIGHGDIAPGRKVDPNIHFPWKQLADSSYGNWFDDTTGVELPVNFDHLLALRIVGYDIRDTTAVIRAFKRHWLQDSSFLLQDADKKVLYQLQKKFR